MRKGEFELTDSALTGMGRYYTREAGVRNLEREISKLARNQLQKSKNEEKQIKVTMDNLGTFLGQIRIWPCQLDDQGGVVTGLAWTSVGGDLLHIEALKLPGKGRMKTTGKLGDVMKNIDAANSYVALSVHKLVSNQQS